VSDFQIRLFAAAKQTLQSESVIVHLAPPHTLNRLQLQLACEFPAIATLVHQSRFAVNATYAAPEDLIQPSDEVALIPPVSGG
jgi:molybdopterin converting factor small subunit